MPLQETGVKASVQEYSEFMTALKNMNKGVQDFGKVIAGMAKQAGSAQPQINNLSSGMGSGFAKATSGMVSALTAAAGGVGSLVSALGGPAGLVVAIGAAVIAITTIISGIKKMGEAINQIVSQAINSFFQFAQQGLMLASRFREMENAAIAVGRTFGIADDATRESIRTLEDANIRYDIAASSVMKMTKNQIDLANATDLARIAQATGIMIGEDSSATLERLVYAITTGNTAMLGFMNITVRQNEIEKEALDLYGKHVDALTAAEKTQARVNAIIKASQPIMGVYDAAMDSAGKSLRSLTGRLIPTLGAEMMKTFEPAFKTGVDAVSKLVKSLIAATQEGGALYPILIQLGAYASLAADAFKWVAEAIGNNMDGVVAVLKWGFEFIDDVLGIILQPGRYVVEMGQLFLGLKDEARVGFTDIIYDFFKYGAEIVAAFAEGIVSAAHQAMTVVANAISGLLSFWFAPGSPPRVAPDIDKWGAATMTEYLKGFGEADFGTLKTVQQALGAFLDPKQLGKLSKQLIGDIAAEGGIGEAFFGRVASVAGVAGQEIAKLARMEFNLAEATRRMEEANERYSQSQLNVTKEIQEYNKMLAEGASEQELAAKLAKVQAAEQERTAAATEAQAAAQDLTDQEKALGLQRQLVDQLTALQGMLGKNGSLVASAAGTAKGIADGLKDAMDGMGDFGDAIGGDISNKIGEAIDKLKEDLKAKFKDIFQPLIDAWGNIQEMIFGKPIREYKGSTLETRYVGGIVQLYEQMRGDIETIVNDIILKWELLKTSVSIVLAVLYLKWNEFKTNLIFIIGEIGTTVSTWVNKVNTWFTVDVPGYIDTLVTEMNDPLMPAWEALRDIIGAPENSVFAALTALNNLMGGTFITDTIAVLVDWIWKKKGLLKALEAVEDVMWRIGEAVGTLVTYIQNAAREFVEFLNTVDNARNTASPFIGESPSPLERGISGAAGAMRDMIPTVNRMTGAFSRVGMPTPMPVSTTAGAVSTSTRTTNLNIGSVVIQGDMSWADFKTRVTRAIVTSGA